MPWVKCPPCARSMPMIVSPAWRSPKKPPYWLASRSAVARWHVQRQRVASRDRSPIVRDDQCIRSRRSSACPDSLRRYFSPGRSLELRALPPKHSFREVIISSPYSCWFFSDELTIYISGSFFASDTFHLNLKSFIDGCSNAPACL